MPGTARRNSGGCHGPGASRASKCLWANGNGPNRSGDSRRQDSFPGRVSTFPYRGHLWRDIITSVLSVVEERKSQGHGGGGSSRLHRHDNLLEFEQPFASLCSGFSSSVPLAYPEKNENGPMGNRGCVGGIADGHESTILVCHCPHRFDRRFFWIPSRCT